jgi:hypothetical protein
MKMGLREHFMLCADTEHFCEFTTFPRTEVRILDLMNWFCWSLFCKKDSAM